MRASMPRHSDMPPVLLPQHTCVSLAHAVFLCVHNYVGAVCTCAIGLQLACPLTLCVGCVLALHLVKSGVTAAFWSELDNIGVVAADRLWSTVAVTVVADVAGVALVLAVCTGWCVVKPWIPRGDKGGIACTWDDTHTHTHTYTHTHTCPCVRDTRTCVCTIQTCVYYHTRTCTTQTHVPPTSPNCPRRCAHGASPTEGLGCNTRRVNAPERTADCRWRVNRLCLLAHMLCAVFSVGFAVCGLVMEYWSTVLRTGYGIAVFLMWFQVSKVGFPLSACRSICAWRCVCLLRLCSHAGANRRVRVTHALACTAQMQTPTHPYACTNRARPAFTASFV